MIPGQSPDGDCLLIIDLADVHVGKLCVETETGHTYSREIAIQRMVEGTRELIRKAIRIRRRAHSVCLG